MDTISDPRLQALQCERFGHDHRTALDGLCRRCGATQTTPVQGGPGSSSRFS